MMQPYLRVTGIRQAVELLKRCCFFTQPRRACLFVQIFLLKVQMKIPDPR
jgi:hypothetical protein